jgi:hypothetical protein
VDVPYGFDSGLTFTIPASGNASSGFVLIRNTAKMESPLADLVNSPVLITLIARVTFYGHDQAGNEIAATGDIGVTAGDFGASC